MAKNDKRLDAYIAKSADFAKPILEYVRSVVHEACPDVEETLKWGHPFFEHRGSQLCSIAAFKEHCKFGFWKGRLVTGDAGEDGGPLGFGRVTSVSELPSKRILAGYVKKAMELNDQGVKAPKRPSKPKKPLTVPDYFTAALKKNKKALAAFDNFPPSHQREYVEWITDAKTEETRQRRLTQALEWMAEGKPRNWKYM
jgi:uncharacterized protein YdeI (YjbR/CyaY-like superfamily)